MYEYRQVTNNPPGGPSLDWDECENKRPGEQKKTPPPQYIQQDVRGPPLDQVEREIQHPQSPQKHPPLAGHLFASTWVDSARGSVLVDTQSFYEALLERDDEYKAINPLTGQPIGLLFDLIRARVKWMQMFPTLRENVTPEYRRLVLAQYFRPRAHIKQSRIHELARAVVDVGALYDSQMVFKQEHKERLSAEVLRRGVGSWGLRLSSLEETKFKRILVLVYHHYKMVNDFERTLIVGVKEWGWFNMKDSEQTLVQLKASRPGHHCHYPPDGGNTHFSCLFDAIHFTPHAAARVSMAHAHVVLPADLDLPPAANRYQ